MLASSVLPVRLVACFEYGNTDIILTVQGFSVLNLGRALFNVSQNVGLLFKHLFLMTPLEYNVIFFCLIADCAEETREPRNL